ncbi:class I SAM-dependent methyltransferase [Candidatus Woesebacteria bacterium]|nr:class I SAM-dependent methyltransferase [Candidatus Woesebacteria bacterium]
MSTDPKSIHSYNQYAEKWLERIQGEEDVVHEYLDRPAMKKKLPKLKGKSVLCVGCGTGEECAYLKSLGVKEVVGIDISEGQIKFAQKHFPNIRFYVMDMENISFPDNSFDFVYSSLTLHYVKDWTKTLKQIYRLLRKGGTFLFSTHHPVKWGAETKRGKTAKSILLGYVEYKDGRKCEIFGDYLNVRKIKDIWFDEFEVVYYHKPFSSIMKDILNSGFRIVDFIEPKPLKEVRRKNLSFWQIRQKIPLFMIFELRKDL